MQIVFINFNLDLPEAEKNNIKNILENPTKSKEIQILVDNNKNALQKMKEDINQSLNASIVSDPKSKENNLNKKNNNDNKSESTTNNNNNGNSNKDINSNPSKINNNNNNLSNSGESSNSGPNASEAAKKVLESDTPNSIGNTPIPSKETNAQKIIPESDSTKSSGNNLKPSNIFPENQSEKTNSVKNNSGSIINSSGADQSKIILN